MFVRMILLRGKMKIIVLFGMGNLANDLVPQIVLLLGKNKYFFFDNDETKWGSSLHGIKCINRQKFLSLRKNTQILITTRLAEQIIENLVKLGFNNLHACAFERGEARIKYFYNIAEAKKARTYINPKARDVSGSWCYITGASRGIGAKIAASLADRGVNLVIHSRRLESLSKIRDTLERKNIEVVDAIADFSDDKQLEQHCKWIVDDCPTIDFAYINAGVSPPIEEGSFQSGTNLGWLGAYQVNLIAPWKIVSTFLEHSKLSNYAKLMFITSSISGSLREAAYACSKAALNKMVGDLARVPQPQNVDFCLIDPGWISTDMGGASAPNDITTILPGAIFPVLSQYSCNGSWISVQDYRGLTVEQATQRAYDIGDLEEAQLEQKV